MNRSDLIGRFSQVVGITKAEEIVSDAEEFLGFSQREQYSPDETSDLCEEIILTYDGYIEEIANEIRISSQAQHRFDTLFENIPNPGVVVRFRDNQAVIKTVNKQFERVFGYSQAEAAGQELAALIFPGEESSTLERWLAEKSTADREVTRVTKSGESRDFIGRSVLDTTIDGTTEGYAVYADITDRITRERELQLLKQLFSRVFRHNIRNELSVVKGHLELIKAESDNEQILESVTTALHSADRLLSYSEKTRTIEDLIDVDQRIRVFSLEDIIQTAIKREVTPDSAVSISVDVPEVRVSAIEGFDVAIRNAIENAIEHNPSPVSIDISAQIETDTVSIAIADNGSGIADGETKMLSVATETPLTHGSGIGLWVMDWYLEKSNGELAIVGTDNGTTVTMTLPRAK